MVLPITTKPGFYNVYKTMKGNQWYSRDSAIDSCGTRYGQSQPWDRPLPYTRQLVLETAAFRFGNGPEIPDAVFLRHPGADSDLQLAYERAYNKLKKAINSQGNGEMGITLAQSALTYKLYKEYLHKFVYFEKLGNISKTLDRFAFSVRKAGDATSRKARWAWRRKAAKILGCRPPTDREVRRRLDGQLARAGTTGMAAEYLAFHYGWSPLFADIYQLLKFLSEGINYPGGFYQESGSSYTNTRYYSNPNDYIFRARTVVKIGCRADVENEPLYSLGVLGLANPAAIAWDAMKWSFVVDWVLSIGPRISNQTSFLGVVFSQDYRTTYYDYEYTRKTRGAHGFQQTVTGYDLKREPGKGISPPTIRLKNPIIGGWRKAFAQISLLALFGLKPK